MRPELFRLFDVGFPSYFVLLLSGFFFATALGALWARRIGMNPDVIVDLGLAMLLVGVAGSRILHVIADGHFWEYVHMCTDPSLSTGRSTAPSASRAAYDGVWDAARGVCHPEDLRLLRLGEVLGRRPHLLRRLHRRDGLGGLPPPSRSLSVLEGRRHGGLRDPDGPRFGRMGCLLAGCCFGAVTKLPWGLSFPPRSPASDAQAKEHLLHSARMWSEPVHPTQVYESAASLAVAFVCLYVVLPRKRYDGQVFAASLVLYALARFAVEILRRDDRGGAVGLSTSQLIGLGLIVAAAVIHRVRGRTKATAPVPA